jgi:hypothetical protein
MRPPITIAWSVGKPFLIFPISSNSGTTPEAILAEGDGYRKPVRLGRRCDISYLADRIGGPDTCSIGVQQR